MKVPFHFVGQIGENRSVQFSSEVMRNVYMVYSESNERWNVTSFPGLKSFSTGTDVDRGDHVMANIRYVINGSTLYKELSSGARTSLGTVAGTDRAIFADDGTNLYFIANSTIYKWNGTALSTITQSVVTNPSSIDYLNRKFIITGDSGLFATSDAGDGDTYNALNFAEAETRPDGLRRCYVFNQLAYMLGTSTTEPWYDSGLGNPPLERQNTALVNVGLAGKHAVCNTDQFMYWLGDDRKIYQCVGSAARPVNTAGVSTLIESFSTVSDCIASSFVLGGQDFVMLKFPTAKVTLVYSEQNKYFVELSAGTGLERKQWYGNSVSQCYGKNLVTDYRNGNTYELDLATYTDNGDSTLHIVVPRTFTGKDIGIPGRQITATSIRFNMQVGVGLTTGQGSNPQMMCQFSHEGGEVWQAQQLVNIDVQGSYANPVEFWDFATGYEVKARVMWSDPVPVTIFDGIVDLIDGGY